MYCNETHRHVGILNAKILIILCACTCISLEIYASESDRHESSFSTDVAVLQGESTHFTCLQNITKWEFIGREECNSEVGHIIPLEIDLNNNLVMKNITKCPAIGRHFKLQHLNDTNMDRCGSVLSISNITSSHAGNYTCKIRSGGKVQAYNRQLVVIDSEPSCTTTDGLIESHCEFTVYGHFESLVVMVNGSQIYSRFSGASKGISSVKFNLYVEQEDLPCTIIFKSLNYSWKKPFNVTYERCVASSLRTTATAFSHHTSDKKFTFDRPSRLDQTTLSTVSDSTAITDTTSKQAESSKYNEPFKDLKSNYPYVWMLTFMLIIVTVILFAALYIIIKKIVCAQRTAPKLNEPDLIALSTTASCTTTLESNASERETNIYSRAAAQSLAALRDEESNHYARIALKQRRPTRVNALEEHNTGSAEVEVEEEDTLTLQPQDVPQQTTIQGKDGTVYALLDPIARQIGRETQAVKPLPEVRKPEESVYAFIDHTVKIVKQKTEAKPDDSDQVD